LIGAAMELFAETGYERTTAADIAARAGVTERTFFRHFADKREVLFGGSDILQHTVVEAIAAAPAELTPLEAALVGVSAAGTLLEDRREFASLRSRIIAANPSLQERELLKLAALTDATAAALVERGASETVASLAAHSSVTVFHVAFGRWVSSEAPNRRRGARSFADWVTVTADELRALT
jgi:AcrR family transcriptional regulator